MDEKTIKDFGDMVTATEQLTKPWRVAVYVLAALVVITNLFWGIAMFSFIHYAYTEPETSVQYQDNEAHEQYQSSGTEVPDFTVPAN